MTVDELLEQMQQLITAARALDLQVNDDSGAPSPIAVSASEVAETLAQTAGFLDQVQIHYDFPADAEPTATIDHTDTISFNLDSIGLLVSSELAAHEIGRLAHTAGHQLRAALSLLDQAEAGGDRQQMVSACNTALRRFRRAVLPLEIAICEHEQRELPVRSWSDLVTSLDTRSLYGKLRRRVFFPGVPADDQLPTRLREILDSIGELRATEIYPSLRVEDRRAIRALARQIKEWLGEPQPTAEGGRKLWNDLVTFVNRLAQINQRRALCRHDWQVIAEVWQALSFGPPGPANPDAIPELTKQLRERLRQVLGRDDQLDRMILEPNQHSQLAWQEPLQRLLATLEPAVQED